MDVLPILGGVFIFAVTVLFIVYTLTSIKPFFNNPSLPSEGSELFNSASSIYPKIMDNLGVLMAVGLPLVAAALAYVLNSSPVFFWLLTGFSFIFVIFGGAISFLWEKFAGSGAPLASAAAQLPKLSWLLGNYAVYALFVIALLLGAIFMRLRGGAANVY